DRLALGHIFQEVAGLAIERFADLLQRFETDAFHAAGLEQRQIGFGYVDAGGKLARADLAQRQHDIEADDDRHQMIWLLSSAMRCASPGSRASRNSRPDTKRTKKSEPSKVSVRRVPGCATSAPRISGSRIETRAETSTSAAKARRWATVALA